VQLGTFQPIREAQVEANRLHSGFYEIAGDNARKMRDA
jgi:S-adenosylmethionine:tRNA-ribosyltransferase-isomerase (queuine synthetase)